MTQHTFDFPPPSIPNAKEIQQWVEKHNQQVNAAAHSPTVPPGSLAGALDSRETKTNAVYLLRGVLSQQLRRSLGAGISPPKKAFLKALKGEILLKNTNQDPSLTVRNVLMRIFS